MEQTFWQKLFNIPAGAPSLEQAYNILADERDKKKQIKATGSYELKRPIELDYGTATRSNDFESINRFRDFANEKGLYASPNNKQLPKLAKEYSREYSPEVLGTQLSGQYQNYDQRDILPKEVPSFLDSIPQIKGREPVSEIMPDEETIQKYVKNAKKWAGTVSADKKLTFRQKKTVKDNAEYVGRYVEAVMRLAPYFDLPPKTMAAMLMKESGWGGQRFDGNLGGYGFLDSGEDMGIRFDAPTIEEQAAKYLEKVATDWNGRYQGSRTPEDFVKKGYNTHSTYAPGVRDVLGLLER